MDRRQFLRHLIAFGAVVSLPVPIEVASAAEVDDALKRLDDEPVWFEVDSDNTIRDPAKDEPEYRWQVFPDINPELLRSAEQVLALANATPLWHRFQSMASEAQGEVEAALEGRLNASERRKLKKVAKALSDHHDGLKYWIRREARADLPRLRAVVAAWLADPIDWEEFDYFDTSETPIGSAKAFFEELDQEHLSELEIAIIEGDRPGSSYHAAELLMDIQEANSIAKIEGMPFRFRPAAS